MAWMPVKRLSYHNIMSNRLNLQLTNSNKIVFAAVQIRWNIGCPSQSFARFLVLPNVRTRSTYLRLPKTEHLSCFIREMPWLHRIACWFSPHTPLVNPLNHIKQRRNTSAAYEWTRDGRQFRFFFLSRPVPLPDVFLFMEIARKYKSIYGRNIVLPGIGR